MADALRSWRPELLEFQPKSPLPWIELDDEDLQIQIQIYEESAGITMPYFRERAQEMMECVVGCAEIVKAAGGYVAYDPQLGRTVGKADLKDMLAQYCSMDKQRLDFSAHRSKSSTAGKPWWKLW